MTVVLVTGANGFVGRNVCRSLLEHGHEVRAVVRTVDLIPTLPDGARPLVGDLSSGLAAEAFQNVGAVVHLAARAHVMREESEVSLAQYRRDNVELTARLVAAAAGAAVRRFVYVSSVKVHGEGGPVMVRATDPVAPVGAYARSKAAAEDVVRTTSGTMEWTIIRPCFVYGAGGKGNFSRLVSLAAVAARIPLPLANIRNRRSLIYVENLASLLVTCVTQPEAARRMFLAADAETLATPDLIRRVGSAVGVTARLFPVPLSFLRAAARLVGRTNDMDRLTESYVVDAEDVCRVLRWRAPFTLDEALARAVARIPS